MAMVIRWRPEVETTECLLRKEGGLYGILVDMEQDGRSHHSLPALTLVNTFHRPSARMSIATVTTVMQVCSVGCGHQTELVQGHSAISLFLPRYIVDSLDTLWRKC
jgi:hypothetical protein